MNYEDMYRIIDRVTPKNWVSSSYDNKTVQISNGSDPFERKEMIADVYHYKNADFITTFDPPMVRTLLDKIIRLEAEAEAKVGMEIVSNHPNSYMAGNWFTIQGLETIWTPTGSRLCYSVYFESPDGAEMCKDLWAVVDSSANYQFRTKD